MMKPVLFVFVISLLIAGCATTNNDRGIAPTCEPTIGMSEAQFLKCACIRPLLNPDGGVKLISSSQTRLGTTKLYACSRYGKDIQAVFSNGVLQTILSR